PPTTPAAGDMPLHLNIFTQTWRLIARARENPPVFLAILGISWFWLVGFVFLAQFPVYASEVLYADEGVVTLFLTLFSVGIAVGSLLCNRILEGQVSGAVVPLGALGMTVSIFAFWL